MGYEKNKNNIATTHSIKGFKPHGKSAKYGSTVGFFQRKKQSLFKIVVHPNREIGKWDLIPSEE
jgi:hypothetical protein